MKSMRLILLMAGLSSFYLQGIAQTTRTTVSTSPVVLGDPKRADDSQEGVVIERYITKIAFESDGTSSREISTVARVQAEAGVKELAVLTFAYTSESETVDVDYVRVRKADGKVVNTPAYNIQDLPADVTRSAPMYSDIHAKHITVKALGVGDTLEYRIVIRVVKPEIPGHFWFQHSFIKDGICKDEQLEISYPKDKYVNISSTDVNPAMREEGGRRIYTWKSSNLSREVRNEQEIPKRYTPRPSVEVSAFKSWEEVGRWYGELQKDQIVVTPEVKTKAAEITKRASGANEKIGALYNYVSTQFHYVSLSFGIGRYQPHAAADVLGNEYGDCKDKHTLLAALLQAEGIEAWPVLINSSRKIDEDIPSPGSFDHVITAIPQGNKIIWLDTTPEVSPFGLLFANLRNTKALVVRSDGTASLMTTPDALPFPSMQQFEASGKLDSEGTFKGRMQQTARGDSEVILRASFRQVSRAQWKELTQRFSYAWGFGGDVSEVVASTPEDTLKPFQLSYDYTRKKYADWDNHRITPPMPPFGIEVPDTDERKPVEPFLLGAPGEVVYKAKVELPSFSKASAPANVDLVEDFAEYHARYAIENGVLTAERKMVVKKSEVAVTSWDRYRAFRKAVSDDESHWIDLDGPSSPLTAGQGDASDAGNKYREALQALQGRQIARAEELLHRVLELDPKYQPAHATLGQVYIFQNRLDSGFAEIRREEELHPEFKGSYILMASILTNLRRNEEAIEQWRKLLKVDPENRDAALNASQLLMQAKRYGEAVTLLEDAVKASPESDSMKLWLGFAYLNASQKDKGLEFIRKGVNEHTNAEDLNSAAYELADANVGLELAKKYSEQSLQLLEPADPGARGTDESSLVRTQKIGPYWDTLGWIYFRMGNLEKAAAYLRAAWVLMQDGVAGDHLGQVYQKQGKRREAEHVYVLALAVSNGLANKTELRQHYRQLTGKLPSEQYSTHRLPDGTWTVTPGEELSRMRTVKIATQSHAHATATFSLLISDGKIAQVDYVSGAEDLKPVAGKAKNTKLDFPFPESTASAWLSRRGILTCESTGCDLTFLLPSNQFLQGAAGF